MTTREATCHRWVKDPSALPCWNPLSNKRRTVLIVLNYAEREMQAFS